MVSLDTQCAFYEQLQLLVTKYMTHMLILGLGLMADFFVFVLGFDALAFNILALT